MHWIDIAILIPLLWYGFKGLREGAVMECIRLISVFAGLYAAIHFSSWVGSYLHIKSEYSAILYFCITFIAVVAMLFLAGYLIDKFVKAVSLGWINHLLGLVFALVKTAILISMLFFFFNKLDPKEKLFPTEKRDASILFRSVEKIATWVLPSIKKLAQEYTP